MGDPTVFRRHKKPTKCAVRCRIVRLETQNFVYMTIVGVGESGAGWGGPMNALVRGRDGR